jgi:hypothetical protein
MVDEFSIYVICDPLFETWEQLRQMGRQDCAYSSHKPRAFCAPDIAPLEAMHGVLRLEKLFGGG